MREDLQKLYRNRFPNSDKRIGTWIEICRFIETKIIPYQLDGTIVDVAAGYCDFINQIHASHTAHKFAIDANPDVSEHKNDDVTSICDSVDRLSDHFAPESVSLFFMSNFLEHITKKQITELFRSEFDLLKKGGYVLILTPNIKYVGGKYWDFFDHITPLTDMCIIELAETMGFKVVKNIKRFLPYTTKSKLPQSRWIVSLYLRLMPFSGLLFGEQSLILLKKDG